LQELLTCEEEHIAEIKGNLEVLQVEYICADCVRIANRRDIEVFEGQES
jgi:hypothetical protein